MHSNRRRSELNMALEENLYEHIMGILVDFICLKGITDLKLDILSLNQLIL